VIAPEHIVPKVSLMIEKLEEDLKDLEEKLSVISNMKIEPQYSSVFEPAEHISDQLSHLWSVVSHLQLVKDSEELREAVKEVDPLRIRFSLKLSQNVAIFEGLTKLRSCKKVWDDLEAAQQRAVDLWLKSAKHSGVALQGEQKERFNEIQEELTVLSRDFSNNVLDSTKKYSMTLTKTDDIKGLPKSALEQFAQAARSDGHDAATAEAGPWKVTLDGPSYIPFITYAENRELREILYRERLTIASGKSEEDSSDNSVLLPKL